MPLDHIHRYEEAGVQLLLVQFHPMLQGLDIFIEEVMPLLRRTRPARPLDVTKG